MKASEAVNMDVAAFKFLQAVDEEREHESVRHIINATNQ